MDLLLLFKALILGVVEGLTEFLPISSTGHLILASDLLNFNDEKGKVFTIVIQLGAILAVCWEYRAKIGSVVADVGSRQDANRFVLNILIAFLPAAILGLLFIKTIKQYLFHPVPVATAFIVGGVLILWAERRKHVVEVERVEDMDWKHALKVGLMQCLALIPGTSRSGATISTGMLAHASKERAERFSFALAVVLTPPVVLREVMRLLKASHEAAATNAPIDLHGSVVTSLVGAILAFGAGLVALKWLSSWLEQGRWYLFGIYCLAASFVVFYLHHVGY